MRFIDTIMMQQPLTAMAAIAFFTMRRISAIFLLILTLSSFYLIASPTLSLLMSPSLSLRLFTSLNFSFTNSTYFTCFSLSVSLSTPYVPPTTLTSFYTTISLALRHCPRLLRHSLGPCRCRRRLCRRRSLLGLHCCISVVASVVASDGRCNFRHCRCHRPP